jgi:hypothetical protein
MNYRVYLTQTIVRETEAESEQDAIKWAEETPELGKLEKAKATSICELRAMEEGEDGDDEVDHKEVEAHCEACDRPILEGEPYECHGEDCYAMCQPCAEMAKEAFKKAVEEGLCGYCGFHAHLPSKDHCEKCTPEDFS